MNVREMLGCHLGLFPAPSAVTLQPSECGGCWDGVARVWYQGAYGGGCCEQLPEAPPSPAEPIPAISRMEQPLAKAKASTDGGDTSGTAE